MIQNRKVRKIRSMETRKQDTRREREKKMYAETNKRKNRGRRKEKGKKTKA